MDKPARAFNICWPGVVSLGLSAVCCAALCAVVGRWAEAAPERDILKVPDGAPVVGMMVVGGKTYLFRYALICESKEASGEEVLIVLASDRKLPTQRVQQAFREGKGADLKLQLNQPFMRATYTKAGEPKQITVSADQDTLAGAKQKGPLERVSGRARGKIELEQTSPAGAYRVQCDVDGAVLNLAQPLPKVIESPPRPVGVKGKFAGNGRAIRLTAVSVAPGKPDNNRPTLTLVFTEKDHTRGPDTEKKAKAGEFGCALIVNCLEEGGEVLTCAVEHPLLEPAPFSGLLRTSAFEIESGQVRGLLTSDGRGKFSADDTLEVDLEFVVKLPLREAK